jgi:sphingomyelin phosphodiesterase
MIGFNSRASKPLQLLLALVSLATLAAGDLISPSTFTAPGAFPTSLYSSYYNNPTATASEPQPVISDPVLVSCLRFIYLR